jgi:esterase/lipase
MSMKRYLFALALVYIMLQGFTCSFYPMLTNDLGNKNVKPQYGPVLLSAIGQPAEEDKNRPVILTIHGYRATPFENKDTIDYLAGKPDNFLFSRVMMGGHGVSLEEFEKAGWRDWQAPLEKELDQLDKLGYKHLNVIANSAGGTLLLDILSRKNYINLERVVLIAPLIEFADKDIKYIELAQLLGIRAIPASKWPSEYVGNEYNQDPVAALLQLKKLTKVVKKELKKGITIPVNLRLLIVQSTGDKVVDPVSSKIIRRGIKGKSEIFKIKSENHVMVNIEKYRTEKDKETEQTALSRIYRFLRE